MSLDVVLDSYAEALPGALNSIQISLDPSHHHNRGEVAGIVQVLLCKVTFSFVDHGRSLLVVEGFLVLDDFGVGLGDDRDQEVHENDEDEEHGHDEDATRIQHYQAREPVLGVSFNFWVIDYVETVEQRNDGEVPHGTTQHRDSVGQHWRRPSVVRDVHLNYLEALSESHDEDSEQNHKEEDFIDNGHQHGDEEVQLPEHPDQVDDLGQRHRHTHRDKDASSVGYLRIDNVQHSPPSIEEVAQELEVVPRVCEVVTSIEVHLYQFVDEEEGLHEEAHRLAEDELEAFVTIAFCLVEREEVDIVEHQEDHVDDELREEEGAAVLVPLVVDHYLDALLLKQFNVLALLESVHQCLLVIARDLFQVEVLVLHFKLPLAEHAFAEQARRALRK
mmetsp:Transcript_42439/g.65114  ORF Transcript_42439/g.65114 Transcript_42439/m.65114 type:complete len:389 (-) Transcript_42439:2358-3524(-)